MTLIKSLILFIILTCIGLVITRLMEKIFTRFRSRENKVGKEFVYRNHPKRKKPLGGGVAIFTTIIIGILISLPLFWNYWQQEAGDSGFTRFTILILWIVAGLVFAGIGFYDDWRKVNASRGLHEYLKLTLQCAAALIITFLITYFNQNETLKIFLPYIGQIDPGYYYLPIGIFIIVGASNAVNLTDGMDGLAGSCLADCYLGFFLLAIIFENSLIPFPITIITISALIAFLIFNKPQARIIMGDTGALGMGAAIGVLGMMSHTEWLLLLFCAPFLLSVFSVIIQVAIIKFFRGPVQLLRHQTTEITRPFICTPLHHHYQSLGDGPWKILGIYNSLGLVSLLLGLLAFFFMINRHTYFASTVWLIGLGIIILILVFAAFQKLRLASFFFGLSTNGHGEEKKLTIYKGMPITLFGNKLFHEELHTSITESMINKIAAEGILWRNVSEIEASISLGKMYNEFEMHREAAVEWEKIPQRNLLLRTPVVVALGRIYLNSNRPLKAIELLEKMPEGILKSNGLIETINQEKHKIEKQSRQAYEQVVKKYKQLRPEVEKSWYKLTDVESSSLIYLIEFAIASVDDLRALLNYQFKKREIDQPMPANEAALFRQQDEKLAKQCDEMRTMLEWARAENKQFADVNPIDEITRQLNITPHEMARALGMVTPPVVQQFQELHTQSRNSFYRMTINSAEGKGVETIIAKCYREKDDAFFGACYRRENGVLAILSDINAPVPKIRGGYLGAKEAVLFLDDAGDTNLAIKLKSIPETDRTSKLDLLRAALGTLIEMHTTAITAENRLEHEVSRVVKEVLTPDYYINAIRIALTRMISLNSLTRPSQTSATTESLKQLQILMPPITSRLLGEPRTFIHFEFTPGNILLKDDVMTIVDFEQSTIGPAVFDVATLLYNPEANLRPEEIKTLLDEYNSSLPQLNRLDFLVRDSALEAAAVIKLLIYAGSAVNFYHKFHDGSRLQAKEWYLKTALDMMKNSENQIFPPQLLTLIARILGKDEYIK